MLRAQPTELIRADDFHYVAKCQAFDGRAVEFIFTAELDDTNIDGSRELKHQDAFFFVVHDDEGGWSLLKAAAHLDSFDAKRNVYNFAMLQLPTSDFRAKILRASEDNAKPNSYDITFTSGTVSVKRTFSVSGTGTERLVEFENRTWAATLHGAWWRVDGSDSVETPLVLALIYFDWSRNYQYFNSQLKERSEKIPWDTIFLQSEKNDEKRNPVR